MALRLKFPSQGESPRPPMCVSFKPPWRTPPWPWRATMFTALNCYLLWSFAHLQYVATIGTFSYRGKNLWFYGAKVEPFGLTVPESFLIYAIALSLFALGAVASLTYRTPRLWKRLFAVILFATFAIGFALLNLHLRHACYESALRERAEVEQGYKKRLKLTKSREFGHEDSWLRYYQKQLARYDFQIEQYRASYPGEDSGIK